MFLWVHCQPFRLHGRKLNLALAVIVLLSWCRLQVWVVAVHNQVEGCVAWRLSQPPLRTCPLTAHARVSVVIVSPLPEQLDVHIPAASAVRPPHLLWAADIWPAPWLPRRSRCDNGRRPNTPIPLRQCTQTPPPLWRYSLLHCSHDVHNRRHRDIDRFLRLLRRFQANRQVLHDVLIDIGS